MASMMALPREGHLSVVLHAFSFLKRKHNGVALFDHAEPEIDQTQFSIEDQSVTPCGPCEEDGPSSAPVSRCEGFAMRAFIGSEHSGVSVARHTSTMLSTLLYSTPVFDCPKKQGSFKRQSFG